MVIYKNVETIFIANGGTDDTEQCRLSGEPLIETMLPETGGHPPQLEMPFVKQLVGPPRLRVSTLPTSFGVYTGRSGSFENLTWTTGNPTAASTGTGRPVDAIVSPGVAYCAVPHGLNTEVECSLWLLHDPDVLYLATHSTPICATPWTTPPLSFLSPSLMRQSTSKHLHTSSITRKMRR